MPTPDDSKQPADSVGTQNDQAEKPQPERDPKVNVVKDGIESANDLMLKRLGAFLIPAVAIILTLVCFVVGTAFWFVGGLASQDLTGQILIVHLVQVGLGALMGVFCILIGVVMCWYGVADTVSVNGDIAGSKLSVQSTRVGLALLIGGMILTGMSLHKSAHGSVTLDEENKTLAAAKQAASIVDPICETKNRRI